MAFKGQQIYNTITSDRITFLETSKDTGGTLLRFENLHDAQGIGPVAHRHPKQEEVFIVERGLLHITIDGKNYQVKSGERITVPRNAKHFWCNGGKEQLKMITEFRPALHFEEIIETIAVLSQKGKVDKKGNPDPVQMSATLNAYYGEFFLATMPFGLQVFLFKPFGFFLRKLLGFKAHLHYSKAG